MSSSSLSDHVEGYAFIEGMYRYHLRRKWADGPIALFCMLNPSTATESEDDPTIRRCIGFARGWGCGSLEVVNLFAWRSFDPKELLVPLRDVVGPRNDEFIEKAAKEATYVIAAWGAFPRAKNRGAQVVQLLSRWKPVHCLGLTKDGAPRHPLYLKSNSPRLVYGPTLPPLGVVLG